MVFLFLYLGRSVVNSKGLVALGMNLHNVFVNKCVNMKQRGVRKSLHAWENSLSDK